MTRRVHLLATAFALATLSLTSAPGAHAQTRASALAPAASPESVGFDSQRLKKLDAAMAQAVASGRVVGMQTLLARHGKVVATNTYGKMSKATGQPMQKDAIFRIYSMSKPITGVAMMILFEEGKWRLDDPVTKFLPEMKDLKVWKGLDAQGKPTLEPVKRPPTMRELMSHTAGYGYGLSDRHPVDKMFQEQRVLGSNSLAEMSTKVAGIPLMFPPGERWSYSVAVDLQGAIVEKLSGQTLGQFMESRIFKPLKMTDTAFMVPADKVSRLAAVYGEDPKTKQVVEATTDNPQVQDFTKPPVMESGGGGLVGTTADYARFAQMIANGGELDGVRILSPAAVEMMGTNQIPAAALVTSNGSAASFFNESVGFGLDFLVVNDPRKAGSLEGKGTMSWGGAAGTWFWVDPTNDVIFVGMIQQYSGTGDLGGLSRTLVYQALVDPAK
ncbi:serine hydrolase domain-containing protein [Phenylobacterium sp.]|uniref:serine hydrolase domain-containing protein n=1 Tax=Phenylobacterium sp. TaxID=1871053 RepID=UPI00286B4CE4|nr:serine hydrolase domain-containing protein [Phenylobacterium sp.]